MNFKRGRAFIKCAEYSETNQVHGLDLLVSLDLLKSVDLCEFSMRLDYTTTSPQIVLGLD